MHLMSEKGKENRPALVAQSGIQNMRKGYFMRIILLYMLRGKMTFRSFALWLGVGLPVVGVCWLVLAMVYKLFEIVSYFHENIASVLNLIFGYGG